MLEIRLEKLDVGRWKEIVGRDDPSPLRVWVLVDDSECGPVSDPVLAVPVTMQLGAALDYYRALEMTPAEMELPHFNCGIVIDQDALPDDELPDGDTSAPVELPSWNARFECSVEELSTAFAELVASLVTFLDECDVNEFTYPESVDAHIHSDTIHEIVDTVDNADRLQGVDTEEIWANTHPPHIPVRQARIPDAYRIDTTDEEAESEPEPESDGEDDAEDDAEDDEIPEDDRTYPIDLLSDEVKSRRLISEDEIDELVQDEIGDLAPTDEDDAA